MTTLSENIKSRYDRRKENRVPLIISIRELSSEGTALCLSSDISPTGMAVKRAAENMPEDGEKIVLEFSLPGIASLITIPSTYLRAEKKDKVQDGVVIFEKIPSHLKEWISWAAQQKTVFVS
jgi:PilZ domain